MPFHTYMHVERLNSDLVAGLLDGPCYIFPKIDGTNACIWAEGGEVQYGSRKRWLQDSQDNQGFKKTLQLPEYDSLRGFVLAHPELTLYGEFLVPHTLRTYVPDAWQKFYVFDVWDGDAMAWVNYMDYLIPLSNHDIAMVPLLTKQSVPTIETLTPLLEQNTWLMKEGEIGEGIVIKRYDYVNRYGKTIWGKIVRPQFREEHHVLAPTSKHNPVEARIVARYMTEERVNKVLTKMGEPHDSSRIKELLNRAYNELVVDEIWNILKKFHNPTINFRTLRKCCESAVKIHASDMF